MTAEASNTAVTSKLIVRCAACNGEDILRDAWACWSFERQEWELGQVFDQAFCETCESDCNVECVPADMVPAD
jgi:hypothetical protein